MKTVLLSVFVMLIAALGAFAQTVPVDTTNGRPYYILLKDGSHIYGRIIGQDSTIYTVRMRNGQLTYVEKALFRQLSNTAPVMADSVAYFTQSNTSGLKMTQPTPSTVSPGQYEITLIDGTTLRGQVLSRDSSRVVLKTTTIGTVYVPAERVSRMQRVGAMSKLDRNALRKQLSSVVYPNSFPQYLNFTPTAYQAERGRAYYRNTLIYFNQIDYGITDNWSAGFGLSLLPTAVFSWLTTKLSAPLGDRARIGLQGQYFFGAGQTSVFDNSFRASYIQGLLSLGDRQKNVTIGLGVNVGQRAEGQILTVAYVKKVGPQVTFISENQLLLNTGSYVTVGKLSGGVRLDRQRHSFDLSLNVPVIISSYRYASGFGTTVFPSASYQVRLGK